MQQDEWVVSRVFRKSVGAKKYPSSNPTRATLNPYNINLEVGPSINMQPQPMMHLGDHSTTHFLYGRNYINTPDLVEVNRVLRSSGVVPLPMQYSNLSSSPLGFTISGLNLNLGGASTQPSTQVHDFSSNMMTTTTTTLGGENHNNNNNLGYGGEVNINANPNGNNRYMGMEHCVDLDNYWPSY